MQTLAKYSSRHFIHPKSVFGTSLRHVVEENNFNNGHILQLWNNLQICRFFCVSKQSCRLFKKEYRGVYSLLRRSGVDELSLQKIIKTCRNFSVACLKFNNSSQSRNKQPEKTSSDSNKPESESDDKKDSDKEPSEKERLIFFLKCTLVVLAQVVLMVALMGNSRSGDNGSIMQVVSWNDFIYHILLKGEVARIVVHPEIEEAFIYIHPRAVIKGTPTSTRIFQLNISNLERFEEKIRDIEDSFGIKPENGVTITYDRSASALGRIVALAVFSSIIYLLFRNRKKGSLFPFDFMDQMKRAKFTLVDPLTGSGKGVRFSEVAGLKEAKVEVMELVDYLKRPEHYKILGAKVPKGALLLGPPGCGKTMLAKAVATEANVPFLSMNGTEFIEMVGGVGAARVRDLFQEGKKRAPSIIYIDEIDSLGKRRLEGAAAGQGVGESEQTLNQLLVEMDGMGSRGDVIILASTNRPEVLDKALLRPGRFDRHISIDLPTLVERKEIFEQHLKCLKLEKQPNFYSSNLAHMTPGLSGADIANVCNEAALCAARTKKKQVDSHDLLHAIDRVLAGIEIKNHSVTPSEKRMVAYREAAHALVAWLLEHSDALLKVTIIPRSKSFGFTQQARGDLYLLSKERLLDRICVMLGGRAAETLIFNKSTTANKDEFREITKLAYSLVREYGMNSTVGLVSFPPESTNEVYRKPYSKYLGNLIDAEASRLVAESFKRTQKLLSENKDKLTLIAEELLIKETMTYEDVEKLIGPPPFGKKQLVNLEELHTSIEPENSQDPPEQEGQMPQPSPA